MSLALFYDNVIPKYEQGKWIWDSENEIFKFNRIGNPRPPDYEIKAPKLKFGIQFKDSMNQIEEKIFRDHFARSGKSVDFDVVTIQDIKDIALYTAPTKKVSKKFITFFHKETLDQLLNDLIIYMDYFVKVVEFLLIRRDDLKNTDAVKIRNMDSIHVEKVLSQYLCQYRLILAREYSKLTIGVADMKPFHHRANKMNISMTDKDRIFFETFLCFCTRIVWIALHRRAYSVIDFEINRLFRSGHFNVAEKQLPKCLKFSKHEEEILYGINDYRVNCRNQRSPLILEILNVSPDNVDILWTGEQKYRGNNPRMCKLELEYVTPDSQLSFVDVQHGILGHPKTIYDTLLDLDWHYVRKERFSEEYDPYRLIRTPYLKITKWSEFKTRYVRKPPICQFDYSKRYDKKMIKEQIRKWKHKNEIFTRELDKIFLNEDRRRNIDVDDGELLEEKDENEMIEICIKNK